MWSHAAINTRLLIRSGPTALLGFRFLIAFVTSSTVSSMKVKRGPGCCWIIGTGSLSFSTVACEEKKVLRTLAFSLLE